MSSVVLEDLIPGFAVKARIRLTYSAESNEDMPETLIVKGHLAGHQLGNSFSYEVETRSYADVVPGLSANAPVCYFAGIGAGGPVVILEDLKPKNVRFLDPLQPLTREMAAAFLATIARIHACHWNNREITEEGDFAWLSENSPMTYQMNAFLDNNVSSTTWHAMSALPRSAAVPFAVRDLAKVQQAYAGFRRFRRTVAQTIIHGDEHPANFYVEADGTPGFLDWQCRKEAWSVSFAYFLVLCLDVLDRRAWEKELLSHYLECLTACGVVAPAFEDAWSAYRRSIMFPYNVWFTNQPVFQPEIFCTACAMRAGWAMYDHGVFDLLN